VVDSGAKRGSFTGVAGWGEKPLSAGSTETRQFKVLEDLKKEGKLLVLRQDGLPSAEGLEVENGGGGTAPI